MTNAEIINRLELMLGLLKNAELYRLKNGYTGEEIAEIEKDIETFSVCIDVLKEKEGKG